MATPPTGPNPGAVDQQSEFYELLVKSNAEQAIQTELLKQRAKFLNETATLLREEVELQNSIARNMLNQVSRSKDLRDQIEGIKKASDQISEEDKKRIKDLEHLLAIENQKLDALRDQARELQLMASEGVKMTSEQKAMNDLFKIKIKLTSQEGDVQGTLLDILKGQEYTAQQKRDALEQAKGINKQFLDIQRKVQGVSEKAGKSLGLSASYSDTMLGKAEGMVRQFADVKDHIGQEGMMGMLKGSVGQTFNLKAGLSALIEKIVEMGMALDAESKKLGASTGFGNVFSTQLLLIQKNGNMAGVSAADAAAAIGALSNNVSSFNPKADKANAYMGTTVARLAKLGVGAESSAKSIDHMQRAMGMTAEQAADATAQIARMGKEIGISGTKMINDFNAASGRLAIYGKQNVEVFKKLAAAAKASGIEMQTLISLSTKFDKFDSAADSVAKLNSVLGTQLSTIDMLNASDADRVLMIRQQVQASVGNFDSLDKFTKMHVAEAMGLKDVAEAQKLLNMSTAEYQKYRDGQQEAADIQAEMAEASESLVPIQQQLSLAFSEVALAFSPLILLIADFFKFLSPAIAVVVKFTATVLPWVLLLGAIAFKFGALSASVAGLLTPVGWLVAGVIGLIAVLQQLFDIFHLSGSPMLYEMFDFIAGAVGRMAMAFASPITMVGALVDGFKSLWDGFHNKEAKQSFDVAAMAKLDTSKVAEGFGKIKSVLMDISKIKMDGFIAIRTDGASTSLLMGSEDIVAGLSNGTLTVDVKMPEFQMPEINVKVYIGNTELRDIIRKEAKAVYGGAG